MIKAHFENKSLVIDLSNIWEEYYWKDISFTLKYWMELKNWENDYYSSEWSVSLKYNWENSVTIKVKTIKTWYRWETIWIWYYIEADLWSKLLIFRDTKDINIWWREESVFHSSDLENVKSWEYILYTDEKDGKEIRKEIFRNYIKDLLYFIPNLIKIIFSSIWAFIIWCFSLMFIGSFLELIIALIEKQNIYFWYISALIIYLLIVYIYSYFKYSKMWIDIKFNKKFILNKKVNEYVSWVAKKEINDIEVKVFWINQERGWYEYDCGSSTCTAYINKTVWNTLLFSKNIKQLKIWEDIWNYLQSELDINKIYDNLFYSQSFSSNMWLFVWLEFRIISKKYSDIVEILYIDLDKEKFKKQINLGKTIPEKIIEKKAIKEEEFNNDFFI